MYGNGACPIISCIAPITSCEPDCVPTIARAELSSLFLSAYPSFNNLSFIFEEPSYNTASVILSVFSKSIFLSL